MSETDAEQKTCVLYSFNLSREEKELSCADKKAERFGCHDKHLRGAKWLAFGNKNKAITIRVENLPFPLTNDAKCQTY